MKGYRPALSRSGAHVSAPAPTPGERLTFIRRAGLLENYNNQYDLLLDGHPDGRADGIETSWLLRQTDPDVCLIFITSMEQLAIQGYQVEAFRYLLKPLDAAELFSVLDKAFARIDKQVPQKIFIRTLEGETQIDVARIEYAEICQRRLWIHCGGSFLLVQYDVKPV